MLYRSFFVSFIMNFRSAIRFTTSIKRKRICFVEHLSLRIVKPKTQIQNFWSLNYYKLKMLSNFFASNILSIIRLGLVWSSKLIHIWLKWFKRLRFQIPMFRLRIPFLHQSQWYFLSQLKPDLCRRIFMTTQVRILCSSKNKMHPQKESKVR